MDSAGLLEAFAFVRETSVTACDVVEDGAVECVLGKAFNLSKFPLLHLPNGVRTARSDL